MAPTNKSKATDQSAKLLKHVLQDEDATELVGGAPVARLSQAREEPVELRDDAGVLRLL